MELSKPGQTTALPTGLLPSQQLTSSDNQLPIFTSTNWVSNPNRPNNPNPASLTVRPFNAPSRILMPWESVAVQQSPNPNPLRPEKVLNPQTSNRKLPQMEVVSPRQMMAKGAASKASNKRPIQQIEVSPKAQSASATESVRSKLRESLAAALSVSTGEKTQEQNGEEDKGNQKKEEGENDCESMVDELLQGNGLSWAENSRNTPVEDEKSLAIKIEAELFGLFGGVNKKYKEKGRSLLFNLKDPSNPDLRVRVLSGDIKPEKLCLMSAEELASKELSEWRQAKAEEMAQAIVLPEADVDMRKRVKKTHKGEFVVIEEEKDSSWAPLEAEIKAGASVGPSAGRAEQPVKGGKVEDEGSDLMLEIMGDGFGDLDHLSPVVTLDEFMKDLDSEPPFTELGVSNSEEKSEKEEKSGAHSDVVKDELVSSGEASGDVKQSSAEVSVIVEAKEDKDGKVVASGDESRVKSDPVADKLEVSSGKISGGEHGEAMWEGVVQLNVSSLASVVAFYRSGEKPSMKEWPGFIEIKGRVRLEPFEKFLKELPLSRTRAIMIAEIRWKEGSMESGRQNLSETIESYIADARVGFAEPSPGVELYLSPTNEKMLEMFGRLLPKEHSENLKPSAETLIGIIVWRRPLVTTVSPRPRSSSLHHNNNQQQSTTINKKINNNNNNRKKEQVINFHSPKPTTTRSSSFSAREPVRRAPSNINDDDDDDGDVPPGFGHMVNNNNNTSTKYDDDLPEFDFGSASKNANKGGSSVVRPVQEIRELIQKYGSGTGGTGAIEGKSWDAKIDGDNNHDDDDDDDDDDIPEWNPNQDNRSQPQIPPQNMQHTQNNMPPIQTTQYVAPSQQILPPPPPPLVPPQPTFRPAINVQPNYQPTNQWWGRGEMVQQQPSSQFGYRMPNMAWRPDFPRE